MVWSSLFEILRNSFEGSLKWNDWSSLRKSLTFIHVQTQLWFPNYYSLRPSKNKCHVSKNLSITKSINIVFLGFSIVKDWIFPTLVNYTTRKKIQMKYRRHTWLLLDSERGKRVEKRATAQTKNWALRKNSINFLWVDQILE